MARGQHVKSAVQRLEKMKCPQLAHCVRKLYGAICVSREEKQFQFRKFQQGNQACIASREAMQHRERLIQHLTDLKTHESTPDVLQEMADLKHKIKELTAKYKWHDNETSENRRQAGIEYEPYTDYYAARLRARGNKARKETGSRIMTKVSIRQCRQKDGCCARGCGCYWRQRNTVPGGPPHHAHCTRECGCCMRYRPTAAAMKDVRST